MKRLLTISFIIVIVITFTSCRNKGAETIRFAVARHDWAGLAMIAAEKGYFEEQGLNVEVIYLPTGVECLDALISNSVHIGTIASVNVANLGYSGNTNISVVASINTNSSTGIIARRSAGINTPEDLRGKRIAFSPGTTSEIFLARFLEMYNLTGDVELVRMQINTISAAIIARSVDAICSLGPFLYNAEKALGDDAISFRENDYHDMYIGVNTSFANENRDSVLRIIQALEEAAVFANDNVSEAHEIVARIVNLDLDVVMAIWEFHDFSVRLSSENLDRVIGIGEYYRNEEVNRNRTFPDYSVYFDYSFMEDLN